MWISAQNDHTPVSTGRGNCGQAHGGRGSLLRCGVRGRQTRRARNVRCDGHTRSNHRSESCPVQQETSDQCEQAGDVRSRGQGVPAQMLHRATDSGSHAQRATAVWRILRSKCGVLSIGSRAEEAGAGITGRMRALRWAGRGVRVQCASSAEGKASAAWRTWPFSEWRSFKNGMQLREDTRVFVRVLGRALCTEQTASICTERFGGYV